MFYISLILSFILGPFHRPLCSKLASWEKKFKTSSSTNKGIKLKQMLMEMTHDRECRCRNPLILFSRSSFSKKHLVFRYVSKQASCAENAVPICARKKLQQNHRQLGFKRNQTSIKDAFSPRDVAVGPAKDEESGYYIRLS